MAAATSGTSSPESCARNDARRAAQRARQKPGLAFTRVGVYSESRRLAAIGHPGVPVASARQLARRCPREPPRNRCECRRSSRAAVPAATGSRTRSCHPIAPRQTPDAANDSNGRCRVRRSQPPRTCCSPRIVRAFSRAPGRSRGRFRTAPVRSAFPWRRARRAGHGRDVQQRRDAHGRL